MSAKPKKVVKIVLWTLAAIVVIVIPLIVTVAGIVVWIKRRRL